MDAIIAEVRGEHSPESDDDEQATPPTELISSMEPKAAIETWNCFSQQHMNSDILFDVIVQVEDKVFEMVYKEGSQQLVNNFFKPAD